MERSRLVIGWLVIVGIATLLISLKPWEILERASDALEFLIFSGLILFITLQFVPAFRLIKRRSIRKGVGSVIYPRKVWRLIFATVSFLLSAFACAAFISILFEDVFPTLSSKDLIQWSQFMFGLLMICLINALILINAKPKEYAPNTLDSDFIH